MLTPLPVTSDEERQRFCSLPGFPLDPDTVRRQAPDASWVIEEAARCSLWWRNMPALEGRRVGYIGHFAVARADAAVPLLERACEELTRQGCAVAVGPIDGSTWNRYRLVSERGDEPPFFLEPDNPDDWPGHFLAAGFAPLAEYCSAVNTNLAAIDPRLTATAQRLHDQGVAIRPLDVGRFEDELRRVHELSLLAFCENFLYSPIAEADFLAQYRGLQALVRPELCLLAELRGELVGFLFAVPDVLRGRRGEPMDTVILKTLAVRPDQGGLGLGGLLMARTHEAARQLGFSHAIHALFHESNRSGRISGHTARVFRRYTLYSCALASGTERV